MLVVHRSEGEGIFIGPDVHVVLVKNGKGRTTIGVRAPENVLVLRDELVNADTNWDVLSALRKPPKPTRARRRRL